LGLFALALTLTLASVVVQPADAGTPSPRWRVLMLDSSDPSEPVAQSFWRNIREALTARSAEPIEFYGEFLDSLRFQGSGYEDELIAFLQRKYAERPPDLIVAIYPDALLFLERHRTALWADKPALFIGVPDNLEAASRPGPGITGVLTRVDIEGTLALALQLHPQTRRIAVVSGASEFDHLWRDRAAAVLRARRPLLEPIFLDGLPIPHLLDAVTTLPADTIILYTTVFRDTNGDSALPNEVSRQVAEVARVPVYAVFEPSIGNGVVGGSVVSLGSQAQRVGELAAALMSGTDVATLPVEASPPPTVRLDARELVRHGIDEARLPRGAVVMFRPTSIWQDHRAEIAGALAFMALQTALIGALLLERRQRRLAQTQNRRQRVELAHASRLATVGEITASIAHQVNQPLCAIQSNADAAEILLGRAPVPVAQLRDILVDIRRDNEKASDVIRGIRTLLQRREVEMRPLDLNAAVADTLRLLQGEARRVGVSLDMRLEPGLPPLLGDATHLQQVVLNLTLNGIEAAADAPTRDKRVLVRTAAVDDGAVVTVVDTGPGIAPEQMPRLFESFATTKHDGMGLGLSIARSIVEAHGGRISAQTSAEGATFTCWLPAGPVAASAQASHGTPVGSES
jgi:signal transduction histidine kinase